MNRKEIFEKVKLMLAQKQLTVESQDDARPWGGFYVISEKNATAFINTFFPEQHAGEILSSGKLSPKILLVEPGKKLSWQYHHRRAEIWKLIEGTAAVVVSDTDDETDRKELKPGDVVKLKQGERHRLIGTTDWGIVAEIWMHTDPENPSDESDIVRLQDDFGR